MGSLTRTTKEEARGDVFKQFITYRIPYLKLYLFSINSDHSSPKFYTWIDVIEGYIIRSHQKEECFLEIQY